MATLNGNVTIYAILPNADGSATYSVKGLILNAGSPVGEFRADYVDEITAGSMSEGSTYPVSMTVP